MRNQILKLSAVFIISAFCGVTSGWAGGSDPYSADQNRNTLKKGVLGAATGAIAAEASGGKAGTGALVGAGTNVIGSALLDTITQPSQPQGYAQPQYAQPQPVYSQQQSYPQQQTYQQQPVYYGDPPRQPVYAAPPPPPAQNQNQQILKQGLLGAGTGAIAAGASGGKAGKGALIGAGTNVLGGILLDSLTQPSQQQQPVYYPPQQQQQQYYGQPQTQQPTKRIIRKYDAEGNVVSEEEVYQ